MTLELLRGVRYFSRGAAFLFHHRKLWPLVATPLVISLVALAAGAWVALVYLDDLVKLIVAVPSGVLGKAFWVVTYVLGILSLGLAAYFFFFAFAALVASPVSELLSEKVEEIVTGSAPPPFSLRRLARDLMRTLAHESRKILHYLWWACVLFACGVFLPGVGVLVQVAGGAILTARFSAHDALDATMSRKGWSYARKQEFLKLHRARALGLGGGVALLSALPILNAIAIPLGAIGGTLLFLDERTELPE
ncbi:MAG: EI24 domain-containing protein [Deltaproteobacteria bacterium]|nr:EI24 domain-containing protein [Deltaproteobacteria bacterium]